MKEQKITRRPVENAGSSTGKTELAWPNKRTKVEPVKKSGNMLTQFRRNTNKSN